MKCDTKKILAAALAVAFQAAAFPKDKIYVWGYLLDKTPTACPFVFGKTDTSLETGVAMFGATSAVYMNSMFSREYILKHFPKWDRECFENCIDTRLSDAHFEKLKGVPEVWCAIEHSDRLGSAKKIAERSLRYPNIAGVNFDDFNQGQSEAAKLKQLKDTKAAIRALNPKLKIMVVTYADNAPFDMTPFRDEVDVVSRWCWKASHKYWDNYLDDVRKLRAQVGPKVKIVQGLYLHDFGSGMESMNPVPLDIFKKSVRTTTACVFEGSIDGIILPQVGWYSFPTHREHVNWLRAFLDGAVPAGAAPGTRR